MRRAHLMLVSLLAGCASPPGATHGHLSTGFLSSYNHLAAESVRPDVFVWRLEGFDLAGYDAVIVDEPVMRRRLDDCLPSPADRDAMRLSLQQAIERSPCLIRLLYRETGQKSTD